MYGFRVLGVSNTREGRSDGNRISCRTLKTVSVYWSVSLCVCVRVCVCVLGGFFVLCRVWGLFLA